MKTYQNYTFLSELVERALASSDLTEIEGIMQSISNAMGWNEGRVYETACYDAHDIVEEHYHSVEQETK